MVSPSISAFIQFEKLPIFAALKVDILNLPEVVQTDDHKINISSYSNQNITNFELKHHFSCACDIIVSHLLKRCIRTKEITARATFILEL